MAQGYLFVDFNLLVTIFVSDFDLEDAHDAANHDAHDLVLEYVLLVFKACCWVHAECITHYLQVLGANVGGEPAG